MGHLPPSVAGLVDKFREHADHYLSPAYNETLCRIDFINPLFEALGWDMHNRAAYADAYRDVIHEDAIKVGSATKAPDYCFRIGGVRKFFLEAKKPSVDLKGQPGPAYQLRRYAWSAKLPLSILTDFDEFAVYDCRVRPSETDKSSAARIFYCHCADYAKHWEFIQGTFSREAILKGSFDKYAATNRAKRGTAEVDDAFLAEIETWRDALARNIALRNPSLTQRQLNFAVQVTIDRIIFLRICEDRGIERYGQLLALTNTAGAGTSYRRLLEVFRLADQKYNSGLFHFENERGREPADTLTPSLEIDDKLLKEIIGSLYYPQSPYEFSVLSAEILGHVYEQFLGKVITLTAGHRAKVEEKPEVRKAGGVYYTPTYIVDYIVANTVGKLLGVEPSSGMGGPPMSPRSGVLPSSGMGGSPMLPRSGALPPSPGTPGEGRGEGREGSSRPADTMTPKKAAKLRILDPACGSGSFLLGAYQYLLDWHLKHYLANDPARHATGKNPAVVETPAGWRLTTAERKRILLNNIYGVDIDPQAVEVTKLSLLLKVLEGESQQSLDNQMRLFRERALPDLANNIKCGNSLIGPDFYEGQTLNLFDEETRYRINVFDWNAEFPQIMNMGAGGGGFDAVIGNPPYVRIQTLQETTPLEVEQLKVRYRSARRGNYDLYVVFIEKGLSLLSPGGQLGFITPHKFFNAKYGEPVRELIANGRHLRDIIHFGDQQVFDKATTYTCLLFAQKRGSDSFKCTRVTDLAGWRAGGTAEHGELPASEATAREWNFAVGGAASLFQKLDAGFPKLGSMARMFVGLQTSADTVFLFKNTTISRRTLSRVFSKALDEEVEIESLLLKPVVRSGSIGRYWARTTAAVLFPYENIAGKATLLPEDRMRRETPKAWQYLLRNKALLIEREHGKFASTGWHQLYPKNLDFWDQPKLMLPYMTTRLAAHYDTENSFFVNVTTGGFGLVPTSVLSPVYLTGLLNSRLLDWFLKNVSTTFHGGYFAANKQFLVQLPIHVCTAAEKSKHDRIIALVDQMLSLHKQFAGVTAQDQAMIQRQIDATDAQIDRLVYELYGLTDEEIRIVESSLAPADPSPAGNAEEE